MNTKNTLSNIAKIVNLLFLMVLENFVLDCGMGIFSAAFLGMALGYVLIYGGLRKGIAKLVHARNNKGLNGNLERILKPACFFVLATGIVFLLAGFLFADRLSLGIGGTSYPLPIIKVLCLIVIVIALTDLLVGYYNGNGNAIVGSIVNILRIILPIICAFVFIPVFERYGNKVAALLKNSLVTSAYSALAVACIYLVSSFIILIVTIVLAIRIRVVDPQDRMVRGIHSKKAVYGGIIATCFRISLKQLFAVASIAVGSIIYLKNAGNAGIQADNSFAHLGVIFAKLLLPIVLVLVIFSEYISRESHRLRIDFRKDEQKTALVRLQYMIKNSFFMLLPPAIVLTFLADPFVKVFFSGQYTFSAKVLQNGGFLLLFAGLAYSLDAILMAADKELPALGIQFIGFLGQVVFMITTSSGADGNGLAMVYALYINCGIRIVFTFILLYRFVRLELMEMLIKIAKYAASAIMMMILFIILDKFVMMNVFLILLSMFSGYLLYYLALLALKGISKSDETALKRTLNYYPVAFLKSRLHL